MRTISVQSPASDGPPPFSEAATQQDAGFKANRVLIHPYVDSSTTGTRRREPAHVFTVQPEKTRYEVTLRHGEAFVMEGEGAEKRRCTQVHRSPDYPGETSSGA